MKPVVVIAITIGVGALSFFGGMQYQKSKLPSDRMFMRGQGSATRRVGGGQPILGEILTIEPDSLTVKLTDGSTRIVLLAEKTIYNKTALVEKTTLQMGEKVGVFGTLNSDGSVTAQSVQLNPQFRTGR